jgi:arsenate reductase
MKLTVYGIPSCGTVKKAGAWLQARGLGHEHHDLRSAPPDRAQVQRWVQAFGVAALKNTSGGSYRALGPEKDAYSDEEWVAAFTRDPMLIKRPVIERDGQPVLVGFRGDEAALLAAITGG